MIGEKNLHESFYALRDKLGRLKKTAESLLAEIEDIKNGLWQLTSKSAAYELAMEAAENPPRPEASPPAREEDTPTQEESPPEDPPQMKSVFDGKHWDEKKGEWVEEKPAKDAAADGNFELDIF